MAESGNGKKEFVWHGVIAAVVSGIVSTMGLNFSIDSASRNPEHPLRAASSVATQADRRLDIAEKRLDALTQRLDIVADQRTDIMAAQSMVLRQFELQSRQTDKKYQALTKENQEVFHTVMRKLEQLEGKLRK